MNERRAELRLLCSDLIKVTLEGVRPKELTGNLEDIAPSGACVQLEEAVAPGARICLKLGRRKFRGVVEYCDHDEIGYFAGVEFDKSNKWSRKLYEPKHLLDPRKIITRRPPGPDCKS